MPKLHKHEYYAYKIQNIAITTTIEQGSHRFSFARAGSHMQHSLTNLERKTNSLT